MTINLSDEARMATLRTILGYESAVRGLTIGQTFARLVMEAARVSEYPSEVRAQLGQFDEEQRVTAARYTLALNGTSAGEGEPVELRASA